MGGGGAIFCTCHAAVTADNICQGQGADRGSVNHDNPNNVFLNEGQY